jgi:hypothetical protein
LIWARLYRTTRLVASKYYWEFRAGWSVGAG